jgi:hypothetical protein
MANIIDYTYFINEISIPIKSTAALNGAINDSISLYEDEVLKLLLGYKLWKEMKAAYDASVATVSTPLPTKWDRFINGAEFDYTIDGETYTDKWVGLKNASKTSLIANYVYFFHRRNNVSQNSGIGETVSKAENSVIINPYVKCVIAWNKMIDMYGELDCFGTTEPLPSAYNFLTANSSDYPDWKFTKLDKILSPLRMLM